MDAFGPQALRQHAADLSVHSPIQHGYARVEQPADGLPARVGDQLLLPANEGLLVEPAAQLDEVCVGRRGKGTGGHTVDVQDWRPKTLILGKLQINRGRFDPFR